MTKEEKYTRLIELIKDGNECHSFREVIDGLMNEQILECIEQYAEQKAIEFAKWIESNFWEYDPTRKKWSMPFEHKNKMSSKELYSLFNSQSK